MTSRLFTTEAPVDTQKETSEKADFLVKHSAEIQPTLSDSDKETLSLITQGQSPVEREKIDAIAREYETKIFTYKKPGAAVGAKSLLFTANDGGAYIATHPLIEALLSDDRCAAINFLTSGTAEKQFRKHYGSETFKEREVTDSQTVTAEVLKMADQEHLDIGIGTVTSINGPESLLLYSGKSSLGMKKLYFILEGWAGLGSSFIEEGRNLDELDGIFCNDELAKKVVMKTLPDFPDNKIFVTGTGQLDSLELHKTDQYRKNIREKLELEPGTIAVLYLGGVSSVIWEQYKVDQKVEEKTFAQALEAVCSTARENPSKRYAVLFRTHPADPNKTEYFQIAERTALPPNVRCVNVNAPLSINEVASASDMVCSTCSTENFKAHFRGQKGVFMAFNGPGMGYDLLRAASGENIMRAISETNGMLITKSPEEFSTFLANFERKNEQTSTQPVNSTKNILDVIFA